MKKICLTFLSFCLFNYVFYLSAFGGNYYHIKTGGFDYHLSVVTGNTTEQNWLATHHDMVIGLQNHSFTGTDAAGERLPETIYDNLRGANPDIQILQYIPYNTMFPLMTNWMASWCTANGRDPEDIYYHYYFNTTVQLRNGSTITVPGFGGGTAASLAQARVPSTWWAGAYPNVNPTSSVFRDSFNAFAAEILVVNSSAGKYVDGILLDTFEGTADTYYDLQLHNTIEMRSLGFTTVAAARARVIDDLIAAKNAMESHLSSVAGRTIRVIPNAADISNVYNWYSSVYSTRLASPYDELSVEFLIASGLNSTSRIPNLKQLYDDLDRGFIFFVNSQTNYTDATAPAGLVYPAGAIPFSFTQFILATHYLVNHPNAYFSYHKGSASWYGTEGGSHQNSHWHKNIEFNIGKPVVRAGTDYWGTASTNRFFVFADGGATYQILGREYDNALVLAKFGNVGGFTNIGINPTTHALGGNYRRLQTDNTLGPVITDITLGFAEGAILIKDEKATLPVTPGNFRF